MRCEQNTTITTMASEKENTNAPETVHVEADEKHGLRHAAAALDLEESRSTWDVIKANPRICIIIAVVQVLDLSQFTPFWSSLTVV